MDGIAVDDDTATVRNALGTPAHTDSVTWHYPDLVIGLDRGKVRVLSITGPSRATARALKVGEPLARAAALYQPCFRDSTLVQICYAADFDERAVTVEAAAGRIARINVGRILDP